MMTSVSGDDRTYIHYSYKSTLYHPIEPLGVVGLQSAITHSQSTKHHLQYRVGRMWCGVSAEIL